MQCVLADATHVLRPLINHRLQSRARKGLWVRITANSIGGKTIVRRWAKRRVQQAVREELEARNFGMDGFGIEKPRKEIRGTMEVIVRQPTVGVRWEDLKSDIGRLVEAVVVMAESKAEAKIQKVRSASRVVSPLWAPLPSSLQRAPMPAPYLRLGLESTASFSSEAHTSWKRLVKGK